MIRRGPNLGFLVIVLGKDSPLGARVVDPRTAGAAHAARPIPISRFKHAAATWALQVGTAQSVRLL